MNIHLGKGKEVSLEADEKEPLKASETGEAIVGQELNVLETETVLRGLDINKAITEQTTEQNHIRLLLDYPFAKAIEGGAKAGQLTSNPSELLKHLRAERADLQTLAVDQVKALLMGDAAEENLIWWNQFGVEMESKYKSQERPSPEKGFFEKYGPMIGTAVVVGVGIIGITKVLGSKSWGGKGVGALMTAASFGAYMSRNEAREWALEQGVDLSWKAWQDFFEGKHLDSIFIQGKYPAIEKTSQLLDVPLSIIHNVRDRQISELIGMEAKAKRTGESLLAAGLSAIGLESLGVKQNKVARSHEEQLLKFIELNRDRVTGNVNNMTVNEFLKALDERGEFEAEGDLEAGGGGLEKPDRPPELSELEKYAKAFPSTWEALHADEIDYSKVITSVLSDGAVLVCREGITYVVKDAIACPISALQVVGETFLDFATASSYGDATIRMLKNQADWWIGGGAIGSATLRTIAGLTYYREGLGAFRQGALFSTRLLFTLVPETAYKTVKGIPTARSVGTWTIETLKHLRYSVGELAHLSPEARTAARYARLQFHAQRFEHYANLLDELDNGVKGAARSIFHNRKVLERLLARHGEQFLEARGRFYQGIGKEAPKTGGLLSAVKKDAIAAAKNISDEMFVFFKANPEDSLPKIPSLRELGGRAVERVSSFAENTKAMLKKLGLSQTQVETLEKAGIPEGTMDDMAKAAIESGDDVAARALGEVASNPGLAKAFGQYIQDGLKNHGGLALGALVSIYLYNRAENKADAAVEIAGSAIIFKLAHSFAGATRAGVRHPMAAAAVAIVATMGGMSYYEASWKPWLEKYYPNRNKQYADSVWSKNISTLTGATFINTARYLDSNTDFLWDGWHETVHSDTDPLEYLQRGGHGLSWEAIRRSFTDGTLYAPVQEIRFHDMPKLKMQAERALDYVKEERTGLEDGSLRAEELDRQIERLTILADGGTENRPPAWLVYKKVELEERKRELIDPAKAVFAFLVAGKYGEKGARAFESIMSRIELGKAREIKGDDEQVVWEFLFDTHISQGGEQMTFTDFMTLAVDTNKNLVFVKALERSLGFPKGGEPDLYS